MNIEPSPQALMNLINEQAGEIVTLRIILAELTLPKDEEEETSDEP